MPAPACRASLSRLVPDTDRCLSPRSAYFRRAVSSRIGPRINSPDRGPIPPHLDHQDCHIDSYSGVLDLRQVCYRGLMTGLFKSHLSHDCFESWLGAKLVEPGIDSYPDQHRRPIFISSFQPFKRIIFVAKTGVDKRQIVGRNVTLF